MVKMRMLYYIVQEPVDEVLIHLAHRQKLRISCILPDDALNERLRLLNELPDGDAGPAQRAVRHTRLGKEGTDLLVRVVS